MSTSSPKFDVHDHLRIVGGALQGESGKSTARNWDEEKQCFTHMIVLDWDIGARTWVAEKDLEKK